MPHFLQLKFKLDPQTSLAKSPFYGPHISLEAFPLKGETCFFIYLVKNMIFRRDLESLLIFVLFLRKNKIRKKTLSVTPYLEKTVYGKPKSGPGVKLPIGKVRW